MEGRKLSKKGNVENKKMKREFAREREREIRRLRERVRVQWVHFVSRVMGVCVCVWKR